jgi:hypothetical protein
VPIPPDDCPGLNEVIEDIAAELGDAGRAAASSAYTWETALHDVRQDVADDPARSAFSAVLAAGDLHMHAIDVVSSRWAARTYKVGRNCYLLAATSAFREALLAVAELALSAAAVPAPTMERLLRCYLNSPRLGSRWEQWADISLADNLSGLARRLADAAQRFVVLHEMAHVSLGHLRDAPPLGFFGMGAGIDDIAPRYRRHTRQWENEISADVGAIRSFLQSTPNPQELAVRIGAVSLAVSALGALDDSSFWTQPESHPPFHLRIQMVLESVTFCLVNFASVEDREAWRGLMELGVIIAEFVSRATSMNYLPPYARPLSEELRRSDLIHLRDEQRIAEIDRVDEAERGYRNTVVSQLLKLYRIHRLDVPESLLDEVFDDLGRQGDPLLTPLLGESSERTVATVAAAHVWFWESVVVPLVSNRDRAPAKPIASLSTLVNYLSDQFGAETVATLLGLLCKMQAGMYQSPSPSPAITYKLAKHFGISRRNPFDFLLSELDLWSPFQKMHRNRAKGIYILDGIFDLSLNELLAKDLPAGFHGEP